MAESRQPTAAEVRGTIRIADNDHEIQCDAQQPAGGRTQEYWTWRGIASHAGLRRATADHLEPVPQVMQIAVAAPHARWTMPLKAARQAQQIDHQEIAPKIR